MEENKVCIGYETKAADQETLRKQLQLLAERSKMRAADVSQITLAMCEVYKLLYSR